MRKLGFIVETTGGLVTDLAGSPVELPQIAFGDVIAVIGHFREALGATITDMDLSGATALRCHVKKDRLTADTDTLTFQDSYNGGNVPAWENLATGKVCWLVNFGATALSTELGTAESVDLWLEFSYLDGTGTIPQTLAQIQIRLVPQIDTGAAGTPPPSTPTYLTGAEVAAAYVAKALFNAHTIIAATTDDVPAALTVAEQTLVGRITGGNITALTAAQVRTLLSVSVSADTVLKALYDAHTILAATSDDTPAALTVAEQTLVGRITAGNIASLTVAQVLTLLGIAPTVAQQIAYSSAANTWALATITDESIVARIGAGNVAPIAVAASRFVGRKAAGSVAAMTVPEALALLTLDPTVAQQIPYSTAASTWGLATVTDESFIARIGAGNVAPIAVAAERLVGRKATGSLGALTATEAKTLLGIVGVYRTLWIPAASMLPAATNGAQSWEIEYATNKPNVDVLRFDAATEEYAWFTWTLPLECDPSHLKAKVCWLTSAGLAAETVRWGLAARSYTDDDAMDAALGTEVTVDDTFIAQGDLHVTAATGNLTPAGTAAAGETVLFRVARKVAGDNLTGDADLLGILLQYKESDTGPAAW